MNTATNLPGGMPVDRFLSDYWQKQPLLIEAALTEPSISISPAELAGLACEEDVESSLLITEDDTYQQESGPFAEQRFATLPATGWVLQIKAINTHVAELALLQDRFNFLPNWRLDRMDAVYAPAHGTAGPRFALNDVFLLQLAGEQSLQISRRSYSEEDFLHDQPDVLQNFSAEDEWQLKPGALVYLPAGLAYQSISMNDDCLSLVLICRAPTVGSLIAGFCSASLGQFDLDSNYSDEDLKAQTWPGEIALDAREAIRGLIRSIAMDDASIDRWFASFITDVRPGQFVPEPEEELRPKKFKEVYKKQGELWRSEYASYAHYTDAQGVLRLYVAGEEYEMFGDGVKLARLLAANRVFRYKDLVPYLDNKELLEVLTDLYNIGALYFP